MWPVGPLLLEHYVDPRQELAADHAQGRTVVLAFAPLPVVVGPQFAAMLISCLQSRDNSASKVREP